MSFVQDVMRRISPFLKQRGFTKSSRTFRIIKNDVAYCVGFDAPSGILYVTVFLMPLYMPCDNVHYTYGNRMSVIQNIALPVLNKASDSQTIDQWCKMFVGCIDAKVIPFFETIQSPKLLIRYMETFACKAESFISCSMLHILRLRLFTYLYLGEYSIVADIAVEYLSLLKKTTYLADAILQCYVAELDRINILLRDEKYDPADYIANNIQETLRKCF